MTFIITPILVTGLKIDIHKYQITVDICINTKTLRLQKYNHYTEKRKKQFLNHFYQKQPLYWKKTVSPNLKKKKLLPLGPIIEK